MRWHLTIFLATAFGLTLFPLELAAQARTSNLIPPPPPLRPVSVGQMRIQNEQAAAQFGKGQVAVPPDGVEIELPESPSEVIFTNCGWRLAMVFGGVGKIGIFNLSTLKFDGYIPIAESGVMIASGGTLLAVYIPSSRVMDVYDLNTLEKRAGKALNLDGTLAGMAMGLYQPLQIIAMVDKGKSEKFGVTLIRLPGFESTTPEVYQDKDIYRPFRSHRPLLNVAAEESGSSFFATFKGDASSSAGCYHIQPDNRILLRVPLASFNTARPDRSGKYIVSHSGLFMADNPDQTHAERVGPKETGSLTTPVVGHDSFVTRISSDDGGKLKLGFRVYAYDKLKLLAELPVTDETSFRMLPVLPYPNQAGGNWDLLAAATSYRIVHIGSAWPKMRIYPLGSQR